MIVWQTAIDLIKRNGYANTFQIEKITGIHRSTVFNNLLELQATTGVIIQRKHLLGITEGPSKRVTDWVWSGKKLTAINFIKEEEIDEKHKKN